MADTTAKLKERLLKMVEAQKVLQKAARASGAELKVEAEIEEKELAELYPRPPK